MKKMVLSREEKLIEDSFDDYRPVSRQVKKTIETIIDRSRKSRPVSLRINEMDLERLKKKAKKTGLPYQTMINVVIHKYVNDDYLEKDELEKYLQLRKTG